MRDLSKLVALADQVRAVAHKREQQRPRGQWWKIKNAASDRASVYLYGLIGEDFWGDGNSAAEFASELNTITAPNIDLHINSEGGQVFEGIAIHSAIAQHPAHVTAMIDGLAASAASFIAMAADRIEMAKAAKMMIHDAATGFAMAAGNADQLRTFAKEVLDTADLLDEMSDTIADMYTDRAGGTREQWRNTMRAEKWYSSQEAVDAGLADGIIGAVKEASAAPVEPVPVEDYIDVESILATLKEAFA